MVAWWRKTLAFVACLGNTHSATKTKICEAVVAIREIVPGVPHLAPTPLGLFNLDPRSELFSRPDLSSVPGTPLHSRVHAAIMIGWDHAATAQDTSDPATSRLHKRAIAKAAAMLLDDNARGLYLLEVQPKLDAAQGKSGGGRNWRWPWAKNKKDKIEAEITESADLTRRAKVFEEFCACQLPIGL